MLLEKSLVQFCINGTIQNIEIFQEFVRIILVSYINPSEYKIPIYFRVAHWKDSFPKGSPVEVRGILCAVEEIQSTTAVLMAESIFHCTESEVKLLSPKNTITGEIFLRGETNLSTTVYPHHAIVFAGTGAIRLGPSFYGNRYNFQLHLFRKNIAMANDLYKGDVIKFTGVITHKEGFRDVQIVGKEIHKIPIISNSKNFPDDKNNNKFQNARELA